MVKKKVLISSSAENDTNEAMPDTETKPVNEEEDDAFFMMRKVITIVMPWKVTIFYQVSYK